MEDALHSGEMEGLYVTSAMRPDIEDYIEGRIEADELVARTRTRYGLTNPAGPAQDQGQPVE